MPEKVDYKKVLKSLYNSKPDPVVVDVPPMAFLMIDGEGSTESPVFQQSIQALFSVSYKAKFILKKEADFDYPVMPLEGLWWAEDMEDFVAMRKERWQWTLMIMQPQRVTSSVIERAKKAALDVKGNELVDSVRFTDFSEGRCAQVMHTGPFADEGPTIARLHDFVKDHGGSFDGKNNKHHEIYLSDFRKTDPAKLKTILRQPFV